MKRLKLFGMRYAPWMALGVSVPLMLAGCVAMTLEGAAPGLGPQSPPPYVGDERAGSPEASTVRVTYSVSCQRCEVFAPGDGAGDGAHVVEGQWTRTVHVEGGMRSLVAVSVRPLESTPIRSVRILINGKVRAEARPEGISARQDEVALTARVNG